MKIKIYYYIDLDEEDEEIDEEKQNILNDMNIFNEYIEKDKFNKLFNKSKAKLRYKKMKEVLSNKRKEDIIFCEICDKEIQKNTYDTCHLESKAHIRNSKQKKKEK